MKKLFFVAAVFLFATVDAKAISIQIRNLLTECDIDVHVIAIGNNGTPNPCSDIGSYGLTNLGPSQTVTFNNPAAIDFEIYIVVQPLLAAVMIPSLGVTGACWSVYRRDEQVCNGTTVDVTALPAGAYRMDVY